MNENIVTLNLKKIHLVILIILGLITMSAPAVSAFMSISNNSSKINSNTLEIGKLNGRIISLEDGFQGNHDLLLELKFNLKKFMGSEYVDLSLPNNINNK